MAYINGIRAFGDRSIKRSKTSKRLSTENWQNALIAAEKAHWMLREAAISAEKGPRTEAEKMAEDGVALLKFRSVSLSESSSNRFCLLIVIFIVFLSSLLNGCTKFR